MKIENKYLPPVNISAEGKVAIRAALKARDAIRATVHGEVKVKEGISNVVTEADIQSGVSIRKTILTTFKDQILSEDPPQKQPEIQNPLAQFRLWIVDEIDGSKNFADKIDDIAISIAFAEKGIVKVGVIYNPITDRLFFAEKGKGAFYLGKAYASDEWVKKQISVSAQKDLSKATVETSISYNEENTRKHDAMIHAFHDNGLGIRTRFIGSSVLQLARVAQGASDLHFHSDLKPWDLAAASLLVAESGGAIKRLDGTDFNFMNADSVAGNPELVGQFASLLVKQKDLIEAHLDLRERFAKK